MRVVVSAARIIVGLLFVISGLIKLNDPVGFSFKLEEYFSPEVLDLAFLMPFALHIAVLLVIFETLLGVMLLWGYKPKFTVWSLLLMIVFFTFLTFYSAYFNKVTDCGCFGDAIKLTPWESFTKDVILLVLIVVLFLGKKYINTLKLAPTVSLITLVLCCWYAYYVYNHLPVIDFRPYKIGNNITQGMEIPADAPVAIYDYAWKFMVNGQEEIIVTKGDYPTVEGEFMDVETTLVQEGYVPPIHDFTMEREGVDYAEELLNEPLVLLIVSRVIEQADKEALGELQQLATKAKEKGYRVVGLSASSPTQLALYKNEYGLDFDFYFCDLTTVKTIVRSNPGVLELKEGTITQKLHFNDLEDFQFENQGK